ncbi:MAG: glycosyltransferase family 2 protein [Deltaproteobacteria bacterium]|nr:glycosyltransferase family 2 protein [Deltaproteobacteria bacterium]
MTAAPRVTICIPHWQVKELVMLCVRSIRKYTTDIPYEVIVVDNGSRDSSLDYLRSLSWIRLIERGEVRANRVLAFAEALDIGAAESRANFFLAMHTDVVVKRAGWLGRLVDAIESDSHYAASGTEKLIMPSPFYAWWRRTVDTKKLKLWLRRRWLGDSSAVMRERRSYPRDFCALYRLDVLRRHGLSFVQRNRLSSGESMYLNLSELGYRVKMLPVSETMHYIDHVEHGTAALRPEERRLRHTLAQWKSQRRLQRLLARPYVQTLLFDSLLDR